MQGTFARQLVKGSGDSDSSGGGPVRLKCGHDFGFWRERFISAQLSYEQGPIRPPSEADSLLLRLTRNCPWNRCAFCPLYKGEEYSHRPVADLKAEIDGIAHVIQGITSYGGEGAGHGRLDLSTLSRLKEDHPHLLPVAFWLYRGGRNVFLQDADSMALPRGQFKEILEYLVTSLPSVQRITTYARSRTLLRYEQQELEALRQAGLSRIHVGLESGSDRVLTFMQKGVSSADQVTAGRRVKAAGLSLSEYVILGLGGKQWWQEHALETAAALNRIDPDYIRLRTLAVPPGTPLEEEVRAGRFQLLDDDAVVAETLLLLENLAGINSYFVSDHVLNLLEDLQGRLPQDRENMMRRLRSYLDLSLEERDLFRVGRRGGFFRVLEDMAREDLRAGAARLLSQARKQGLTVDQCVSHLMTRFI